MAIKHLVLGVLASGPASGYRIGVRLAGRAGGRRIESARVYEALGELERAAAVEARESRRADGRSLRLFHLTEDGRRELERWLEAPVAAAEWLRRPLLAKLAIACAIDRLATRALASDVAVRRRTLARLEENRGSPESAFERRVRARQRRHLEIEVDLLEALLARARDREAVSSPRKRQPAASAFR